MTETETHAEPYRPELDPDFHPEDFLIVVGGWGEKFDVSGEPWYLRLFYKLLRLAK